MILVLFPLGSREKNMGKREFRKWPQQGDIVQRNTANGRWLKGWRGEKLCAGCSRLFLANSGQQKWCKDCCRCVECGNQMANHAHRFCSHSCAGKWKYKHRPDVFAVLAAGRIHPNRGRGISRARLGVPRPDMRGELNWAWRGGIYREQRHTLMGRVEYKNWRLAVFERDDYTCQCCGQRGGRLNADHIEPYASRPDLALELSNGRTLCVSCHRKTPTWGEGAKRKAA